MQIVDLAFLGNGIISTISALEVADRNPGLKVAIIGAAGRPFSGSMAAGAMQAVFCEVEDTFDQLPREREIFAIGLEARQGWRRLIDRFGLEDTVTAESTIMYRRKQGTLFEEANFEAACKVAAEYGCLEEVPSGLLESVFCGSLIANEVVAKKFQGEFAIDTAELFKRTHAILEENGVVLISGFVKNVDIQDDGAHIALENGDTVRARRIVIAAGTSSPTLVPRGLKMVPIFHGVGTSMLLDSAPPTYAEMDYVIRTPNRGGAQCGMHIVPRRSGEFYLGAGNYLSDQKPAHRIETIRYLIDICEHELYGKQAVYPAKTELLLGSRPKSLDGYPVVGPHKQCPDMFIATGTYRIGLTIAPAIAAEICSWFEGQKPSGMFKSCAPDRQLQSYASLEVAARYYSESRVSNLIEHGLLQIGETGAIAEKKFELEAIARNFNSEIVKRHGFAQDFVADPDMYAMLMATQPAN